jgi:hypothetical protein
MPSTPHKLLAVRFVPHPTEEIAALELKTDAGAVAVLVTRTMLEHLGRAFQVQAARMPDAHEGDGPRWDADTFHFAVSEPNQHTA